MRRFLMMAALCAALPATAGAVTVPLSGKFTGTTSQGKPVKIKVVDGTLEHSTVQWTATCTTQGTTLTGTTVLTGTTYKRRYSQREVYTVSVKAGMKAKHTVTAQFKVTGHRLQGSFKVVAAIFSKPGVITSSCTTSKVTFNAKS